jgi:hypothetical protein
VLGKLMALYTVAGLLRFAPSARALACLFWAVRTDEHKPGWHRRAQSLARLRRAFRVGEPGDRLVDELRAAIEAFVADLELPFEPALAHSAARYLVEELAAARPKFTTSAEAQRLRDVLMDHLDVTSMRHEFEADLRALDYEVGARVSLSRVWLEGLLAHTEDPSLRELAPAIPEAAVLLAAGNAIDRESNSAVTSTNVEGLLGQHPRIHEQVLRLSLPELIERLGRFVRERVPGYAAYRAARQALLDRERKRLRLDEFMPRVLTSFVRNKLINEVYLHFIGDNLAKQLGAAGEGKRTDLMGLLLLISPPGYGKTTLMEYVASRLGLVFMKINGPSLGHEVRSLDPAEAGNATARQEVEKINLALEMGNNVMLYLDDIQHTHPELLQKFISLCDAQRRIEGVWRGATRTYDLRGKKFCVVMAGNPYTETGEKFRIPDMLANRADTYNLGDILGGKEEQFALSYIENAITSNPVLAPLATREQADIYKLVRMAQGEEIPSTDLAHGYSGVELQEIVAVLQRLFRVQQVLLKVNQQYIASASMDDAYRDEPPFKLQGSYRNMNKLAEKVVAVMNERELESLIEDHYLGEAQTLTAGAEQNLLKLAELRGALSDEKRARWEQIKREFKKQKVLGGAEDDPVVRITSQLSSLGDRLEGIQGAMQSSPSGESLAKLGTGLESIRQALGKGEASSQALGGVVQRLDAIAQALAQPKAGDTVAERIEGLTAALKQAGAALRNTVAPPAPVTAPRARTPTPVATHMPQSDAVAQTLGTYLQRLEVALQTLAQPLLQVRVDPPPGLEELLAQQIAIIERTLVPLVRTTNQQLVSPTTVDERVVELIELLRGVDEQLRRGVPVTTTLGKGGSGGGGAAGGAAGRGGGGRLVPPQVGGRGAMEPASVDGPEYWPAPPGMAPAIEAPQGGATGDAGQEQWRPPPRFRPPST